MLKLKGDVRLALAVAVVAALYLVMDLHLPRVRLSDPLGPRAFPALVGGGLLLSALLLLLETWRRRGAAAPAQNEPGGEQAARRQPLVLAAMAGWTVLYFLFFERAGYLVATSVFLLGLLSYFHRGRHLANLAVAAGFSLAFDLLFTHGLGIPMPPGILSI